MYSENSPFGRMVSVLCLKKTRGFALVLISLLLTATLYSVYNRGKRAYYRYSHVHLYQKELASTLPSLQLVSVVLGTAIPTSLYIFWKCFIYFIQCHRIIFWMNDLPWNVSTSTTRSIPVIERLETARRLHSHVHTYTCNECSPMDQCTCSTRCTKRKFSY